MLLVGHLRRIAGAAACLELENGVAFSNVGAALGRDLGNERLLLRRSQHRFDPFLDFRDALRGPADLLLHIGLYAGIVALDQGQRADAVGDGVLQPVRGESLLHQRAVDHLMGGSADRLQAHHANTGDESQQCKHHREAAAKTRADFPVLHRGTPFAVAARLFVSSAVGRPSLRDQPHLGAGRDLVSGARDGRC
jgi:hypothetical protein